MASGSCIDLKKKSFPDIHRDASLCWRYAWQRLLTDLPPVTRSDYFDGSWCDSVLSWLISNDGIMRSPMKRLAIGFALLFAINVPVQAASSPSHGMARSGTEIVEHGGGCRKSSPPG